MAGIGFELKKLFNEKSATGYLKAYAYTSVVTAGPFILLTSMILIIQLMFNLFDMSYVEKELFTLSIVYPFVFSHIISSGFTMVITRYVADLLYSETYEEIAPSLYGMISLALIIGSVLGIAFFWNKPLNFDLKLLTFCFFMQMIIIWIEGVYLSALKDYSKIFWAYAIGVMLSIFLAFCSFYFKPLPVLIGVMAAMNIGVFFISFLLFISIEKYFVNNNHKNFRFLESFETNSSLFFISFFYTLSIYLPNMVVWQGPMGVTIANTYRYSPIYDVATFYAFLSILPVMIIFVVGTEIHFYQKYAVYFMYITRKGNLKEITEARKDLFHILWAELRNVFEIQFVFAVIFIAIGNYLMPKVGISVELVSMYNIIVLAAYCTGILQLITVFLLYFEDQTGTFYICATFLLTNLIFCITGSLYFGEISYGFSFFLSAFISLLVALARIYYFSHRLDYYIFCSQPLFRRGRTGVLSKLVRYWYPEAETKRKVHVKDI